MKKLNIVLNETSIINFPFLWKLIKRYKVLSISVPLIAGLYSSYTYLGQNTIFSGSSGFKYVSESSNSPTSMIFSMLGEKTSKLDTTEIISYGNSVDFQYRVAEEIMKNDDYKKLNFNSVGSRKMLNFEEMFSACARSKDCVRDKVARIVGNFYSVAMDQEVIDRYQLVVRTLDHHTTDTLVKTISKTINADRLNQIRYFVTSQVKISEDLLKKKKEEIDLDKVKLMLDEQAQLKVKVLTAKNRLHEMRKIYYSEQKSLNRLETDVNQRNITLKKVGRSSNSDLFRLAEAKKLKEKVKQLREDITSIETSFNSNAGRSTSITEKLRKELGQNERKLASLGDTSKLGENNKFITNSGTKKANREHDLKVSRKQYAKTKTEFNKVKEELENFTKLSTELDVKIREIQPNLELIKLLENKLVQLKVAESTIVSDLIFDNYQSDLTSFKKIEKTKMIFVSIFFSFFLLLFVVILRYIFDGRIYDEYELKNNFEELEIIGNTPDFH